MILDLYKTTGELLRRAYLSEKSFFIKNFRSFTTQSSNSELNSLFFCIRHHGPMKEAFQKVSIKNICSKHSHVQ